LGTLIYSPPQRICSEHIFDNFDCGKVSLNNWLITRALKNEVEDASRTYVVCCKNLVVAYYSLHLGVIHDSETVRKIKCNMLKAIPAIVLGRLAVAVNHQGQGLAKALMKDIFLRAIQVSDLAGTEVVLVKALNNRAADFYQSFGFV